MRLRLILCLLILVGLAAGAQAQAAKLVGRWEVVRVVDASEIIPQRGGEPASLTFEADGAVSAERNGSVTERATFAVQGDVLSITSGSRVDTFAFVFESGLLVIEDDRGLRVTMKRTR